MGFVLMPEAIGRSQTGGKQVLDFRPTKSFTEPAGTPLDQAFTPLSTTRPMIAGREEKNEMHKRKTEERLAPEPTAEQARGKEDDVTGRCSLAVQAGQIANA